MALKSEVAAHSLYFSVTHSYLQLIRLDFALRSIAASGLGIQATHDLRRSLLHLRDHYGINTAVIYPADINVKAYKRTFPIITVGGYDCV